LLDLNPSTYRRNIDKGFEPTSLKGQCQLFVIRLYRSLYAISGGDYEFMKHWFTTENSALHGTPKELIKAIDGLVLVNQYLDAMRGKV
jgi:hypothetical protein